MRRIRHIVRGLLLALVLAGAGGFLAGCSTTNEPENEAVRPWNAPKTWETGLPSGMWERR